ncbi:MAG: putative metal-binding motif-containing protein [Pseudomonadota bacterium]|nr:putative metal-binding motif-containing protein [Pseudomonadota bacterium]
MLLFLLESCVFVLPAQREAHLCEVGLADASFGDADGDGAADCRDPEECDGLDNDGDGQVDEALYPDEDGDGYGDETRAGPCYVGWVPTPGDCDDADAGVHPGAPFERCDGKNTRCAADWTEDLDVVTLFPRDPDTWELGEPSDVTDQFMSATPQAFTLYDGELLQVCPARDGAYEVTLVTAADATSVGIHGVLPGDGCDTGGPDTFPTLSGGGETPVTLQGSARGTRVDIDCLGITGGGVLGAIGGGLIVGPTVNATVSRSAIWGNSGAWFGGVWNLGSLTLDAVVILGNSVLDPADDDGGGGIRSEGTGSLEVVGGRLVGNESAYDGGGATILLGEARFYGTTFGKREGGNVAVYRGGALAARAGTTVELYGVRMLGNRVEYTMGGAIFTAGALSCFKDDEGAGSMVLNTTGEPGTGGVFLAGGQFTSYGCDIAGNSGADLYIDPIGSAVTPPGPCFACDAAGCAEIAC